MKDIRTLLFGMTLVIMICGCGQRKDDKPIFDVPTERIDFYSYKIHKDVPDIPPDELVREKTYIKLDTSTDDALFKSIDKIIIARDKIYILDWMMRKLPVFNIDGSFAGLVGRRGQGPGEYLQITDFDVDDSGNVYIVDGQSDNFFIFDSVFHFVSAKQPPCDVGIVQLLPDNRYLFGLTSWNTKENSKWKIAVTNTDFKTLDTCLLYDEYIDNETVISDYIFIQTEKHILYNQPIDNNVYAFSHDGKLEKVYQFDFGDKNVPNEYKKAIQKNREGFRFRSCLKRFVVVNERYCIGTLLDELQTKAFIIDRNSNDLYLSKEIRDYGYMTGYSAGQIITYIYPGKYKDIQSQDLPEDVKEHVENDNFVLCLYKLK
jgi:hypothetical protein